MKTKNTRTQKFKGTREYRPVIKEEKAFYASIQNAMKSSKHKDGLADIIDEFENYKKVMEANILTATVPSDKVYLFRFTYQGKKNVWKEIGIVGDQTFEILAEYLIDEMGWDNDHLHAFFFGYKKGKSSVSYWYNELEIGSEYVDNDQYPILHTNEVLIASVDYKKHPKIGFVFDFGDDHRFLMEHKSVSTVPDDYMRMDFPRVVDQRGVGPEQYPFYNKTE